MFLSHLRQLAQLFGLRETACRACPPEDWAPVCPACGGSMRLWSGDDRSLSDEELVALSVNRRTSSSAPELRAAFRSGSPS